MQVKQDDVKIGGEYLTRVGQALVRVEVLNSADRSGRKRYCCRRVDNKQILPKYRTAAALRSTPDTVVPWVSAFHAWTRVEIAYRARGEFDCAVRAQEIARAIVRDRGFGSRCRGLSLPNPIAMAQDAGFDLEREFGLTWEAVAS
jgi:hypothetical protein